MVPHYDKLIAVMHYFTGRDVEVHCLVSVIFLIITTYIRHYKAKYTAIFC
jgi:hypothetical protein